MDRHLALTRTEGWLTVTCTLAYNSDPLIDLVKSFTDHVPDEKSYYLFVLIKT
jgi:hypothetical protein